MTKNNSWLVWLIAVIAIIALIIAIVALGKINTTGNAIFWFGKSNNAYNSNQATLNPSTHTIIDIKTCVDAYVNTTNNSVTYVFCGANKVLGITPIVHCAGGYVPAVEMWGAANPGVINFPNEMGYVCVGSNNNFLPPESLEGLCCNYATI